MVSLAPKPAIGLIYLQLNLLRDSQSVIHLNAKAANRAFELRVTEQNLDSSQVTRLLVICAALVRLME
jgi:hypothetical protein